MLSLRLNLCMSGSVSCFDNIRLSDKFTRGDYWSCNRKLYLSLPFLFLKSILTNPHWFPLFVSYNVHSVRHVE